MINEIVLFCLIIVLAIIFHEAGHFFYLRNIKLNPYFKWNKKRFGGVIEVHPREMYISMSKKEYIDTMLCGIFAGLIPFFIFGTYLSIYFIVSGFIAYFVGCIPDIINIFSVRKWKDEKSSDICKSID